MQALAKNPLDTGAADLQHRGIKETDRVGEHLSPAGCQSERRIFSYSHKALLESFFASCRNTRIAFPTRFLDPKEMLLEQKDDMLPLIEGKSSLPSLLRTFRSGWR